jgi:predicted membrane-bound mannosyltransferase
MNQTAEPLTFGELPAWARQILVWQQRLSAVDWRPWAIVGLAAALRFFLLGIKPPHFDEGINGWFVDQMVKTGFYRYDPTNYHGPLHFYVLFLFQTLFGRHIIALRLPVVLVSITCVWLTLRFEPIVGRRISWWAAVAMAVSPGFVFYGRYSIHEVWLLFSSMLMILGLLGLWRFGTRGYLWCAGMGLTGMILTKETYVIHAACAALAIPVTLATTRLPVPSRATAKTKAARSIAADLTLAFSVLAVMAFFLPWGSLGDSTVAGPHLSRFGSAGAAGWIILIAAVAAVVVSFATKINRLAGSAAGALQFFTIIYMWGHLPDEFILAAGGWLSLLFALALLLTGFIRLIRGDGAYFWRPPEPVPEGRAASQSWDYEDFFGMIAVGLVLIIAFYSGTFLHWSGLKGLYQAYSAWVHTGQAGQSGHEKPWGYWLKLIVRYEWPVLFGLILSVFCQFFRNIGLRYLAVYGVGTLVAYSIVRYKTPWCIISIVWPFLFVFAGAAVLVPERLQQSVRRIMIVLLALSLASAVYLNYFRCSTFESDDWDPNKSLVENIAQFYRSEPYVYVQTFNDIFKLTRPVLSLANRDPIFYQMVGHMIRTSSYPFPWIFDDFPNVGYYEHDSLPGKLDADFLLVQQDRIKEVEPKLQNAYFTEPLTIRPYQDTSKVYFDAKRFKEFFPGRQPDFRGKASG